MSTSGAKLPINGAKFPIKSSLYFALRFPFHQLSHLWLQTALDEALEDADLRRAIEASLADMGHAPSSPVSPSRSSSKVRLSPYEANLHFVSEE